MDRRQVVGVLLVAVVLFVLGVVLTGQSAWLLEDPAAVRDAVRSFGPLAPLAFVLMQAIQVVVAPVPGHVLAFAAGYLFGPVWGLVYSLAGATVGSYVAMRLARRYGRPWVERFVAPGLVASFDQAIEDYGLLAVFLVFLLPGLPDDVVCLAVGISGLDLRKALAVTVVGRTPGYAVLVLSGAGLAEGRLSTVAVLLSAAGLVVVLSLWQRQAIVAWLARRTTAD